MAKKAIYELVYKNHHIMISEENELYIDGAMHDKDTGLPFGIPLLHTTNVNGKIRKLTSEDIKVRVNLRHTGIGTYFTVYLNEMKVDSKHVIASI